MAEFNDHLPAEDKGRQWSFLAQALECALPRRAQPRGTFLGELYGQGNTGGLLFVAQLSHNLTELLLQAAT